MEKERNSPIEILVTVPFQENEIQTLRELSPRLRITALPAREPGDIPKETWARTEVLYTDRVVPAPDLVPALRWLQFHWAGIDLLMDAPLLKKSELMFTTFKWRGRAANGRVRTGRDTGPQPPAA